MSYKVRCNECGLDHITFPYQKAKKERDQHKQQTDHDIPEPEPMNLRFTPAPSMDEEVVND